MHISRYVACVIFIVMVTANGMYAQYFTQHHIAPAAWQYWHSATEIVLSTTEDTTIQVSIYKSDGSFITTLSLRADQPAVYRPVGNFRDFPRHPVDVVLDAAGMYLEGSGPFSANIRNVASDQLGTDVFIKGNASLTSFGDPGIGLEFRVGYYRDGLLPQRPVYSVMALHDDTDVSINGSPTTQLNKGQSYLFHSPIGSLVQVSKPCVMNTGTFLDAPGGCGDGTFDQIAPIQVLGNRYFLVRTRGNSISEQSTIVSTKDRCWVRIQRFDVNGNFISKDSVFLDEAGDWVTLSNGDGRTPLSVTEVSADQTLVVFSGSAQSCEVDVSTSFPISSPCHGSNRIETYKFKTYRNGNLPYFAYVLLENDTAEVLVNGTSLESLVGPRKKIGDTDLFMFPCTSGDIGNPSVITFSSSVRLQVVIIQIGGGFSMSAAFSNLVEQPVLQDPIYIGSHPCPIQSALLKASSKYAQIQWFLNGKEIPGATDSLFIATEPGNYHIRAWLDCGDAVESIPLSVTLDTIPQGQTEKVSCDPFVWHDTIYTESGTYTQVVQTQDGCDSLAILVLDIVEPGFSTQHVESCEDFFWSQNNQYYSHSGLYSDTIVGRYDCDSVVFLDLKILPSHYGEISAVTCEPYYWAQTKEYYTQSGLYKDTLTNRYGCDSILALNLSIKGVVESWRTHTACDSFLWNANGQLIHQSGTYYDTITSHLGCDSVVILDLTVHPTSEVYQTMRTCDEYYWDVTKEFYDSTGLYTAHFSNKNGCDSTITLDLIIDESYTLNDTVDVIGHYFWKRTQILYTQPGTYYQHHVNQHGCDSSYVLILRLRKRGRVFIPNVFTPDNDFVNDRFTVFASEEIKEVKKLMIFDRWGELMFEQYDFPPNMEEWGWDGTLNGERLLPGVYTYYATWEDIDGQLQEQTGDVTLMR